MDPCAQFWLLGSLSACSTSRSRTARAPVTHWQSTFQLPNLPIAFPTLRTLISRPGAPLARHLRVDRSSLLSSCSSGSRRLFYTLAAKMSATPFQGRYIDNPTLITPKELLASLPKAFERGLESGELLFFESTTHPHAEDGIDVRFPLLSCSVYQCSP